MARDQNAVFFYFTAPSAAAPDALRLRIQYYADDPLNFRQAVFTIDGFDYTYVPEETPRRGKVTARTYWECSDQPLTRAHRDLVYALTHARWVRLKLIGADGVNHVKLLTSDQLRALADALNLYRLLGGKL